jgi:hypothetical protein
MQAKPNRLSFRMIDLCIVRVIRLSIQTVLDQASQRHLPQGRYCNHTAFGVYGFASFALALLMSPRPPFFTVVLLLLLATSSLPSKESAAMRQISDA